MKIPVARLGIWDHPIYKKVVFSQGDFNDIIKNFKENETGFEPYLRYGHTRHSSAVDGEPATAFANDVVQEGDVLFGIFDPSTQAVVDEIRTGQYRYSSAEITRNAVSKIPGKGQIGTVLTAVALTNAPFIPGLPHNQVLSHDPGDRGYFVLDFFRTDAPHYRGNPQEVSMLNQADAGLMKRFMQGLTQFAQIFSGGENGNPAPLLPPDGGSNQTSADRNGPMEKLQVLANRMKRFGDENDETYANRMNEYFTLAGGLYLSAGKTDEEFTADWRTFSDGLKGMGEEFSEAATMAMGLTASPHASTPVYVNGQLVKGRPNQDNPGQFTQVGISGLQPTEQVYDPSGPAATSGGNPGIGVSGLKPTEQVYDPTGAAATSGGNPGLGVSGLHPTLQPYQEGYSASGDNGTVLNPNQVRPMPAYSPKGSLAFLVEALSQSSAQHTHRGADPAQLGGAEQHSTFAGQASQEEIDMPGTPEKLQALETKLADLAQQFSTTVTDLSTKLEESQKALAESNSRLAITATQAQVLSQEAANAKLAARANQKKAEGIAPALVDAAVEMVTKGGHEMRLSIGGAETSFEDALFGLLEKIPADQRINFGQAGMSQALSAGALDGNYDPFDQAWKERMAPAAQ